jgi:predicted acylesterase/phospholipase RssA
MRSLILAGGGIKVGYQAGCLQVLLDEVGLHFDHVDGASGGCFNAAMVANGMTGTQIADAWRRMNPMDMVSFNLREYYKLFWARSISTLDGLRTKVFPAWGLDWDRIQACRDPVVTFNVYDFASKRLCVLESPEMDAELLCACVALPMWFPPLIRGDKILFDAVFCTDGNVDEGVRRGADEMWSIWTVGNRPEFRNGFLAQYFHIIETSADTRFFRDWEEIAAVNAAIAAHGADPSRDRTDLQLRAGYATDAGFRPPPGRKRITQHLIRQEVPIHYLINFSQDRMAQTVEMGVRDAREYCRSVGLLPSAGEGRTAAGPPPEPSLDPLPPVPGTEGLEFTEVMKGYYMKGPIDPDAGAREGRVKNQKLSFRLTIMMDDIDKFIRLPEHQGTATGWVECDELGGRLDVIEGHFNLFVIQDQGPTDDPARKQMIYDLLFRGHDGALYRLKGEKRIHDDPGFDVWSDLTTLYFKLSQVDRGGTDLPFGAGVLTIHLMDFLHQLTTFRVHRARGPLEAMSALSRFGEFFMGQAWDVYARHVIEFAPF